LVLLMILVSIYLYYYFNGSSSSLIKEKEETDQSGGSTSKLLYKYKLWIDYSHWMKVTFIAIHNRDHSSYEEYIAKLNSIVEIIANEEKESKEEYKILLKEHIELSKSMMIELNDGNSIGSIYKQWVDNGEKIASLIASWNSMYSQPRIALIWESILTNLLNQAKAIITNQTSLAISYGELVENQLIALITYLTNFPSK